MDRGTDGVIAYISIGNSDDKLGQAQWCEFVDAVCGLVLDRDGVQVHGVWFSVPHSAFQNACWCVQITPTETYYALRRELAELARTYHQDSIAWAKVSRTDLLGKVKL